MSLFRTNTLFLKRWKWSRFSTMAVCGMVQSQCLIFLRLVLHVLTFKEPGLGQENGFRSSTNPAGFESWIRICAIERKRRIPVHRNHKDERKMRWMSCNGRPTYNCKARSNTWGWRSWCSPSLVLLLRKHCRRMQSCNDAALLWFSS